MQSSVTVYWKEQMQFETVINGHKLILDADESHGGNNLGPRPKPLMMVALAGCTGMDVVSMLKKMRIDVADFKVHVNGDITDEHPMHYTKMNLVYEFWGKNLEIEKLKKAIDLSQERYCGVSASYKKAMEITYEIKINEVD